MAIETDIKVDIGVLKTQVSAIMLLCSKLDQVIEKLIDQHDRHLVKVYEDMDKRRKDTENDIKEIHERIDDVLEKVQGTEKALLDEMKALRKEMQDHNAKEKASLDGLLQWKWMIAGGILAVSWLLSHVSSDTMSFFLK
jgi:6-pyruvoyl-tetrahydropterin synthase